MTKNEVSTLSTGVKAIVRPVPSYLIDNMVAQIETPKPPRQKNEKKGREEENPFDPTYLEAIDEANRQRGLMTMKAMLVYGIELTDPVPESETWLPKLRWLEKHTNLDLSEYDLDDPLDLEFVYKAFIATSNVDIMLITVKSGMSNREVAVAMDGFRSDEEPPADPTGVDPGQG